MANNTNWPATVPLLQDGQPLSEDVLNGPLQVLAQRDQYLYESLSQVNAKSALVALQLPLQTGVTNTTPFIAYWKTGGAVEGLAPAAQALVLDDYQGGLAPSQANYIVGIAVPDGAGSATLYMGGRHVLSSTVTQSGLLAPNETFRPGSFFLSRSYPGCITSNPSGIPVFVGVVQQDQMTVYVNPTVDEFQSYLTSYKLPLLDRPAGVPVLSNGSWTISSVDSSKVGWIPVDPTWDYAPIGASFFYQIPALPQADTSLSTREQADQLLLQQIFPPNPDTHNFLFVNGVLQSQSMAPMRRELDSESEEYTYWSSTGDGGSYVVNDYGIWWMSSSLGFQPWSDEINDQGTFSPAGWQTWVQDHGLTAVRPIFSFTLTKLNPELRLQLVSSLRSYTGHPSLFQFLTTKSVPTASSVGDLQVKFNPTFTSIQGSSPVTQPRAVTGLSWDGSSFVSTTQPLVSSVVPGRGISATNENGVVTVGLSGAGSVLASGEVQDLDPINAVYEYPNGIQGGLKLPGVSNSLFGFRGSIVLPKGTPTTETSVLRLYVMGFFTSQVNAGATVNVAFTSLVVGSRNSASAALLGQTYAVADLPGAVPVAKNQALIVPSSGVTGQPLAKGASITLSDQANLIIPAGGFAQDTVVNFQILRTDNSAGQDFYMTGLYWTIE